MKQTHNTDQEPLHEGKGNQQEHTKDSVDRFMDRIKDKVKDLMNRMENLGKKNK